MSLFKPLCKYCATVTKVRDIAPIVRKAMQIAQSGTPGRTNLLLLVSIKSVFYGVTFFYNFSFFIISTVSE